MSSSSIFNVSTLKQHEGNFFNHGFCHHLGTTNGLSIHFKSKLKWIISTKCYIVIPHCCPSSNPVPKNCWYRVDSELKLYLRVESLLYKEIQHKTNADTSLRFKLHFLCMWLLGWFIVEIMFTEKDAMLFTLTLFQSPGSSLDLHLRDVPLKVSICTRMLCFRLRDPLIV